MERVTYPFVFDCSIRVPPFVAQKASHFFYLARVLGRRRMMQQCEENIAVGAEAAVAL